MKIFEYSDEEKLEVVNTSIKLHEKELRRLKKRKERTRNTIIIYFKKW